MKAHALIFLSLVLTISACRKRPAAENCNDPQFLAGYNTRPFKMGFTSWIYAPDFTARQGTYDFIGGHADIYSEQIDDRIPWQALIANQPLPQSFTNDIDQRVMLRPAGKKLLLSVSLLNINRTGLLEDLDGSIPALEDPAVADAYYRLLVYLAGRFDPDFVVLAMEVNELLIRAPEKWQAYKTLIGTVKSRLKNTYPALPFSESVTLHNWYQPGVPNVVAFQAEMKTYVNALDFAAISFYPFLKAQHDAPAFQQAFDFLHQQVTVPIAFSETAHIAEPLSVPSLNISIDGSPCEQNAYLEVLLTNAQVKQYLFLIWWAHRDYDRLWAIFPESTKDIGLLWRDTGILDQDGRERPAYSTWRSVFSR